MSVVGLDSNILAYFVGVRKVAQDDAKILRTREVIDRVGDKAKLVAPVQALGELFVVLRRNGKAADEAKDQIETLATGFAVRSSSETTLQAAMEIVLNHRLQFWDSVILAASIEAGCSLLLSEDMQDGFMIRGLTVVNPLFDTPHRSLARFLNG